MTLQSAFDAYQAGRLDEAEQQIANHLRGRPFDAMALHLAAMIALKRGDLKAAHARIEAALEDPTNRHEKLNVRGNIWRRLGQDLAAEEAYQAALNQHPDYTPARQNLARLHFDGSQMEEAADGYATVVKANPTQKNAWTGLILALMESQQLDEAERVLSKAPLSVTKANGLRARLHLYRADFDHALACAKAGAVDSVDGADAAAMVLQLLHMTGAWDQADAFIDTLLQSNPDRAELWAAVIRGRLRADEGDAAETLLSEAPKGLPIQMVTLEKLTREQAYDEAVQLAKQALSEIPGHQGLMQHLCTAALGAEQFDLAQSVADFGLKAQPHNQFYYAVKATAGRAKGQNYGYYFNYERFVRPYDLQPPEGWSTMDAFNTDLRVALDKLHGFHAAPLDQTLRLGTQTAPDLRYVDDPAIRAFFQAVDPAIRRYLTDIEADPAHPFLRRKIGGYRIRSAWSVRLGSGGHHVNHVHPEGWISSAYYVDVPEGTGKEGWIKFGEPPAPLNAVLRQGPEHDIQPKAGRLVLFPSYLWHGTYPIADGKSRMTLPIDILPARP